MNNFNATFIPRLETRSECSTFFPVFFSSRPNIIIGNIIIKGIYNLIIITTQLGLASDKIARGYYLRSHITSNCDVYGGAKFSLSLSLFPFLSPLPPLSLSLFPLSHSLPLSLPFSLHRADCGASTTAQYLCDLEN